MEFLGCRAFNDTIILPLRPDMRNRLEYEQQAVGAHNEHWGFLSCTTFGLFGLYTPIRYLTEVSCNVCRGFWHPTFPHQPISPTFLSVYFSIPHVNIINNLGKRIPSDSASLEGGTSTNKQNE